MNPKLSKTTSSRKKGRSKKKKKGKNKKSFAKAFKRDIGRDKELIEESWEVHTGKSLLMNSKRQQIFRYLCEYPCSTLSTVSRDLKLTPPATTWHLKLLVNRKLLSENRLQNKKIFYPPEMIDASTISVLFLLADPKINEIFTRILDTPGITQKELSVELNFSHQSINVFTGRLEKENLISMVRDGKFTRYYPTQRLNELELAQRKKLKEFRKWVIKAFKFDGVNPKLIRATDRQLILQITSGQSLKTMNLSVNPFRTLLQSKQRFLSEL
jgi:DNA-binding MarR family transcriptional regulator